ncbi:MAG: peptidyl-prolyl cis-trans isomerase [Desulfobulbaceae bacterium]|nr:peptidyl-prolyl cis-trans isomerase [Desulfobulbaceae bacterium]
MYGLIRTALLILVITIAVNVDHEAGAWGNKKLVTINGIKYTTEDYKHWWDSFKTKDMEFPDSPQSFIDWHLLIEEARSMELFLMPSYVKKINTFLKARTLMILKYEEVDSKMDITDKDLRKHYEEFHTPSIIVRMIVFDEKEKASDVFDGLKSQTRTVEEIINLPPEERGPVFTTEKRYRPVTIPKNWSERLKGLGPGDATEPFESGTNYVLLFVVDIMGPDDTDFENRKKKIQKELRKQDQAELTGNLVKRLKKKFHVEVDEELFKALRPDNMTPEELLDKILLKTDKAEVTVDYFLKQAQKNIIARGRHAMAMNEEEKKRLMRGTLNTMISQSLTTWEALDRHFEEKEPFKWIYEFYTQHRLIKELEKRFFTVNKVSEEEITLYYKEHLDELTRPKTVKFMELVDEERLIKKMWLEITTGENISEVAQKYYSRKPRVQKVPVDHLDPILKKVIEKLTKGEVSDPFEKGANKRTAIVKLIERKSACPMPLDMVKEKIRPIIKEQKSNKLRNDYLTKLKAESTIEVIEKAWEKVKKELTGNENGN